MKEPKENKGRTKEIKGNTNGKQREYKEKEREKQVQHGFCGGCRPNRSPRLHRSSFIAGIAQYMELKSQACWRPFERTKSSQKLIWKERR